MNLVLLLALLVFTILLVRTILIRAPRYGKPFLIRLGLIVAALILFGLAISGRLHWLFALISGLLPFLGRILRWLGPLLRFLPLYQQHRRRRPPPDSKQAGQRSEVTSQLLRMTLDHDSGAISGYVISGTLSGRTLDSLNLNELRQLYHACQQSDREGVRLLDAYIQRHRNDWTAQDQDSPSPQGDAMTTAEALAILGLEEGAEAEQIVRAHKRMMARMHPDKGGSNYLAAKINRAKELLLEQAAKRG